MISMPPSGDFASGIHEFSNAPCAYNRLALSGLNVPGKVRIFDTTLRDGEQTPGVSLSADDKLKIAKALDGIGVDAIEAGFPIVSAEEARAVKLIADEGLGAETCALARCSKKDIDAAVSCGVKCVHVFIATSDSHLKCKLKMSREEALEKAVSAVEYAKSCGVLAEFSSEDATRTDLEFLKKVHAAVQDAGADRINVPDTVGVLMPRAMNFLVSELKKVTRVPLSVHCHNDLGLAVSNSLAGVEGGAEQVHVTVNGIGERAGNAALEETAVCLAGIYGIRTGIDTRKIFSLSKTVSKLTGVPIQPNKAVVGANAFAHESGIHVHGLIADPSTYEAINPETVGKEREIVIGKHSGVHSIERKLQDYGIKADRLDVEKILDEVKRLSEEGKKLDDAELLALAYDISGRRAVNPPIRMKELTVITGLNLTPTATICAEIDGKIKRGAETGMGSVDAAINALRNIAFEGVTLKDYELKAITGGSDSLCEVIVKLQDSESKIQSLGRSVGPDIVVSSVNAAVDALNMLLENRAPESQGKSEDRFEAKKNV